MLENIKEFSKIGAAVSGGADSMVMLDLLIKSGKHITVVNVEHGIRGDESINDSSFVIKYCNARGVNCLSFAVDAPRYAKQEGVSLELAARILRYQIFDGLLKDNIVDTIALAHHRGDQAETLLMRLFRGTGVRGLRGIADRAGYIHPLLKCSKEEILRYAKENNIPYVSDTTNEDSVYTRNFIRSELLPLIKERYPGAEATLSRTAAVFEELEDYLLSEVTPHTRENEVFFLPISVLSRHGAIAKKSVAECLRAMGIDKDIEYDHLEAVIALKNSPNNARLNLPFGIDAIKEYEKIAFMKREEKAEFCSAFDINKSYRFGGREYAFIPCQTKGRNTFDPDKISAGAVVRTRKQGDVFKKIGGGTKPLAEYFTDIKLPLRQRDSALLIADGGNILAILGGEVGEALAITKETKKIYKIIKRED